MKTKKYYKQLAITTTLTAIFLFSFQLLSAFQPYLDISIICLLFFIGFCTVIYYAGKRTVHHQDRSLFNGVFLGSIFGKLLLSFILLMIYSKLKTPSSSLFLVPFFVVYLPFTIFETFILMKLAKSEKQ